MRVTESYTGTNLYPRNVSAGSIFLQSPRPGLGSRRTSRGSPLRPPPVPPRRCGPLWGPTTTCLLGGVPRVSFVRTVGAKTLSVYREGEGRLLKIKVENKEEVRGRRREREPGSTTTLQGKRPCDLLWTCLVGGTVSDLRRGSVVDTEVYSTLGKIRPEREGGREDPNRPERGRGLGRVVRTGSTLILRPYLVGSQLHPLVAYGTRPTTYGLVGLLWTPVGLLWTPTGLLRDSCGELCGPSPRTPKTGTQGGCGPGQVTVRCAIRQHLSSAVLSDVLHSPK